MKKTVCFRKLGEIKYFKTKPRIPINTMNIFQLVPINKKAVDTKLSAFLTATAPNATNK